MIHYLSRLSRAQIAWLAGSLLAAVALCGIGAVLPSRGKTAVSPLTTAMTLRQMAPRLKTTGAALAKELGLALDVAKERPVAQLGVSQETLDVVAAHLASHREAPRGREADGCGLLQLRQMPDRVSSRRHYLLP